jgi:membrane-associated phospholipid phosphatase
MFDFWRLPAARLCFGCAAVTLAVVCIWSMHAPFSIDASSFKAPAMFLPMYASFMAGSWLIFQRVASDASRGAVVIKLITTRFYDHAAVLVFLLCYAPAAMLLSYLTISLGFPMQDSMLSNIDAALGFDWDAFLIFVNAHPRLGWFLIEVYKGGAAQMVFVFVLLLAAGRTAELWDFVALLMLGSLGTIIISGLLPAIAPYTYYGADPNHYAALERMWPGIGRLHVDEVLQLNSGLFKSFTFGHNHGLVTFPSYHTFEAIVLLYGVRNITWVFWPMAALSTAVVVSTLPIGGHYLADLIGGALLAIAAIALIEKLNGQTSMWARALPQLAALARWPSWPQSQSTDPV